MEDREIIELYNARSEVAIEKTDEKYGKYCRTIAFHILCNEEDTEECVNDTYLRTWNLIPPKCPMCLRTFLGKITRYLSYHVFEKRTAAKRGGGEMSLVLDELVECIPSKHNTEIAVDTLLLKDTLNDFLESLSVEERWILVHRCWHVDSIRDIANRLEISESNVKVILHRTRKKLKRVLEKEDLYI